MRNTTCSQDFKRNMLFSKFPPITKQLFSKCILGILWLQQRNLWIKIKKEKKTNDLKKPTLHRKLKIEQHDPHYLIKQTVNDLNHLKHGSKTAIWTATYFSHMLLHPHNRMINHKSEWLLFNAKWNIFSYIMARTIWIRWDDKHVDIVLDQHA